MTTTMTTTERVGVGHGGAEAVSPNKKSTLGLAAARPPLEKGALFFLPDPASQRRAGHLADV